MNPKPISRFPVPELKDLPQDIRSRILAVQDKAGFVPNVFLALAHRPDEFRAFFAYHDALMEKAGPITKAEREMIVVATSGANQCQYCVVAHGAILRIRAKDPLVADQVAVELPQGGPDAAPARDARLRHESLAALAGNRRRRPRAAAGARLLGRRHLGHRRHQRLLRAVQSHGELLSACGRTTSSISWAASTRPRNRLDVERRREVAGRVDVAQDAGVAERES